MVAAESLLAGALILGDDGTPQTVAADVALGDDLDQCHATQVFRKASDHLRILRIQGDGGNVETIRTTDEHPFYVQSRGWTGAGELSIGELAQEADGTWQAVLGSERQAFADGVTVYNLEVADGHTYFVEDGAGPADAVWVHNSCFRQQVLDRWTQKIGRRLGKSYEAHHVVPERLLEANDLRSLLRDHGIDINDAINGVPLSPTIHRKYLHADNYSYVNALEDRLFPFVGNPERIKQELGTIGDQLFHGTFNF